MKLFTKERLERLIFLINRFRIMKNVVLFKSFGGQYNDNPKYISEMLHMISPNTKIVWVINEKCRDEVPDYVIKIPYEGILYYRYSTRSQVIIDNITGIRGTAKPNYSKILKFIISSKFQFNIATWHGTPIKRIGLSTKEMRGNNYFITSADYLIAGCQYTSERLKEAFYPIPVSLTGTPRNDILVGNKIKNAERNAILEKLSLPQNKKIVLYAPTFRDDIFMSGVYQMEQFDIIRIVRALNANMGGDWVFVFRVHHGVFMKIDTQKLSDEFPGLVYNGNLHDDMAEYLAVTDALITDYSGSIFDYALTGKPGFLYTPDKDHYIREERGTYVSLDDLPYPHTNNLETFYQLIENYNADIAKQRIDEFNLRVGNSETGHASETIANAIKIFIETGKKEIL